MGIGTFCFVQALKKRQAEFYRLDGLTTIITVAAQLLMILDVSREQWLLWIGLKGAFYFALGRTASDVLNV